MSTEAIVPKTSFIPSSVTTELQLVTDGQTQTKGHGYCLVPC